MFSVHVWEWVCVCVCVCEQKRTFYIFRAISGYMAFLLQTRMEVPPSFWQKVEALETSCAYCTSVAGKHVEKDVLDIGCKK